MAKTRMPRDDNSQSIPLLRFRGGGGAQHLSINASTATLSAVFPAGTRVITLVCTVDSFFETGRESVVASASSHFIPAGVPYDMALGADLSSIDAYHNYISVISVTGTGVAHISERE
jgi:hypothetical protein